jgi:hypothetical protein
MISLFGWTWGDPPLLTLADVPPPRPCDIDEAASEKLRAEVEALRARERRTLKLIEERNNGLVS